MGFISDLRASDIENNPKPEGLCPVQWEYWLEHYLETYPHGDIVAAYIEGLEIELSRDQAARDFHRCWIRDSKIIFEVEVWSSFCNCFIERTTIAHPLTGYSKTSHYRGSLFLGCSFELYRTVVLKTYSCTFVDCTFLNGNDYVNFELEGTLFEGCLFDGIDFNRGSMERVRFKGCTFLRCYFSLVKDLEDVVFEDCLFVDSYSRGLHEKLRATLEDTCRWSKTKFKPEKTHSDKSILYRMDPRIRGDYAGKLLKLIFYPVLIFPVITVGVFLAILKSFGEGYRQSKINRLDTD
jgi:hypothetical protein